MICNIINILYGYNYNTVFSILISEKGQLFKVKDIHAIFTDETTAVKVFLLNAPSFFRIMLNK